MDGLRVGNFWSNSYIEYEIVIEIRHYQLKSDVFKEQ